MLVHVPVCHSNGGVTVHRMFGGKCVSLLQHAIQNNHLENAQQLEIVAKIVHDQLSTICNPYSLCNVTHQIKMVDVIYNSTLYR